MINRQNWHDVNEHLVYRAEVRRDTRGTQQTRESNLRLLLIWADANLLSAAERIRPTFPAFVAEQRRDDLPLADSTQDAMLSAAREFFRWAQLAYPRRYKSTTGLFIDSLRPIGGGADMRKRERNIYTVEDVRTLLAVKGAQMRLARIQAAAALLFLSGMRVGALVTLPICAVDVEAREIRQWTKLGVHTKFNKTATTFLLDIPDLLETVRGWDDLVRARLGQNAMWYPNLSVTPGEKDVAAADQVRTRARSVRRELEWLCQQAGVPYRGPHMFRHGHVVHALERSHNPADLKAISQNVMHSSLTVTDGVYGILREDDVRARIARLGRESQSEVDVISQLEALLETLKGGIR